MVTLTTSGALFPFFWEGFPFKLNQPNKDALFVQQGRHFWSHGWAEPMGHQSPWPPPGASPAEAPVASATPRSPAARPETAVPGSPVGQPWDPHVSKGLGSIRHAREVVSNRGARTRRTMALVTTVTSHLLSVWLAL